MFDRDQDFGRYDGRRPSITDSIVVYTKDNCPWCDRAKTILKNNNLDFIEFSIPNDVSREAVIDKFGKYFENNRVTVPIITINGQFVGGSDELSVLFN